MKLELKPMEGALPKASLPVVALGSACGGVLESAKTRASGLTTTTCVASPRSVARVGVAGSAPKRPPSEAFEARASRRLRKSG